MVPTKEGRKSKRTDTHKQVDNKDSTRHISTMIDDLLTNP